MSNELTFKMVGPEDDRGMVEFQEFVRFCETIHECLKASEQVIAGQSGKISYRITEIREGSILMKVQAIRKGAFKTVDPRRETVAFFRKTVADLEKGKVDPRLTPSALGKFRELADPLKRGASRIKIGRTAITANLDKTVAKLLDESIVSEGSVTGMLERLNVHDRNEFIIYPPLIGGQVACSFPESLLETVRGAVKRNVTVTGTQFYAPGNPLPGRIHVTELDVHPEDDDLPTLSDLRAMGKWDTGRRSAVEFVRALRDE